MSMSSRIQNHETKWPCIYLTEGVRRANGCTGSAKQALDRWDTHLREIPEATDAVVRSSLQYSGTTAPCVIRWTGLRRNTVKTVDYQRETAAHLINRLYQSSVGIIVVAMIVSSNTTRHDNTTHKKCPLMQRTVSLTCPQSTSVGFPSHDVSQSQQKKPFFQARFCFSVLKINRC